MRTLLLILSLCWPFGHRRQSAPQPAKPSQAAGHWFTTPHFDDGYWVEYWWTRSKMVRADSLKEKPDAYPFATYRWEWPGFKDGDKTWYSDEFPGRPPEKPKRQQWIPSHDPFGPGQEYNL